MIYQQFCFSNKHIPAIQPPAAIGIAPAELLLSICKMGQTDKILR